jgi:hypothetical protein
VFPATLSKGGTRSPGDFGGGGGAGGAEFLDARAGRKVGEFGACMASAPAPDERAIAAGTALRARLGCFASAASGGDANPSTTLSKDHDPLFVLPYV